MLANFISPTLKYGLLTACGANVPYPLFVLGLLLYAHQIIRGEFKEVVRRVNIHGPDETARVAEGGDQWKTVQLLSHLRDTYTQPP